MNSSNLPIYTPPSIEEEELAYMPMPSGMQTYRAPILPEPETITDLIEARKIMLQLQTALDNSELQQNVCISLHSLDKRDFDLIQQVLGEGEVKIRCYGTRKVDIQEAVIAGIWQIQCLNDENQVTNRYIEVGFIPKIITEIINEENHPILSLPDMPSNLMNAPAILFELAEKQKTYEIGTKAHILNLSLLPVSVEDQEFMLKHLGTGGITIMSKGYGKCRVTNTAYQHIWWVQYYNSVDTLILNTLEVVDIPEIVKAAPEDLQSSAKRLRDIQHDYLQWV